jgi:hypothetical protein
MSYRGSRNSYRETKKPAASTPAGFLSRPEACRLAVNQMQSGAGWADDPLILVFGNIWTAIQLVLDVEAGLQAPENEMGHRSG